MKKNAGVSIFLAVTFLLSWVVWESMIAKGWEPGSGEFRPLVLYGAFSPAFAACFVRLFVTKEGFADAGLGLRLGKWKYYLIAWGLPLVAGAFVLGTARILGLVQVDWTFSSGLSRLANTSENAGFLNDFSPIFLVFNAVVMSLPGMLILFGEEFGWRAYLQKRIFLEKPVLGAVATGLVWSLWHLPLNLRGYNFPDAPIPGAVVFTVSAVFLSVIFGWLYQKSQSIWTVCLAHSSTNMVGASLVGLAVSDPGGIYVSYLGMLGWIPLGGFAVWIILTGRLKSFSATQEMKNV